MKRVTFLLLSICIFLSMYACGKSADPWQEQYALGVRYLSEGNYEEAIIAFNAAIEIEPKREEAYVGLVDVYYALEELEKVGELLVQILELEDYKKDDKSLNGHHIKRYENDDGTCLINEYDASERLVRSISYNIDGTVEWIFDYDPGGNRVRETFYNVDGTVDCYREYEYNSLGHVARMVSYSANGEINCFQVYEYDATGKLVRETFRQDTQQDTLREWVHYIYEYEYSNGSCNVIARARCFSEDGSSISDEILYLMQSEENTVRISSHSSYMSSEGDSYCHILSISEFDTPTTVSSSTWEPVRRTWYRDDGTVEYVTED